LKKFFAVLMGEDITATSYPCIRLTNNALLWFKNYTLYTDNWYTSLMSAIYMAKRNIHLCGTIKRNVRGTPKEHQFPNTGRNKKERGEMKQVKTQVPGTAVYYTSWMDKKPVHVLSTFTASQDVVK